MPVTVCCDNCGAVYDTSVPAAVLERVKGCAECGKRALYVVADSESDGGEAGQSLRGRAEPGQRGLHAVDDPESDGGQAGRSDDPSDPASGEPAKP